MGQCRKPRPDERRVALPSRAILVGASTGLVTSIGFVGLVFAVAPADTHCGLPEPAIFVPILALPALFWGAGMVAGGGLRRGRLAAWLTLGALLSWVWFVVGTSLGGPTIPIGCGDFHWAQSAVILVGCAATGWLAGLGSTAPGE